MYHICCVEAGKRCPSVDLAVGECKHTSSDRLRWVFCFVAWNVYLMASFTPPPSHRWIRFMRSWAGDIDGGDLMSEISSKGRVEYVNVDIATAAVMPCDRILVSRSTAAAN